MNVGHHHGAMAHPAERWLLRMAWVVLCLLPSLSFSTEQRIAGMPLFQRFGPQDYAAAPVNLALLSGKDGSLFVGNAEGVLRFDGSAWTRFAMPGGGVARSLALGPDGRLYVGGYDQFGYLQAADTGEFQYHDLRDRFGLTDSERHVGDIWTIVVTQDAVYFQGGTRLFRLGHDGSTRIWPVANNVRGVFAANDVLYARVDGKGVCRFNDGRFELLPGGAMFADQGLNTLLSTRNGLLLVGDDAFYRYDGNRIIQQQGDAQRIFPDAAPYLAIELDNGDIAVGTLGGELLQFDADLNFVSRVRLGPYSILALTADREGGVWAATEGDLLRLRLPSPWSIYTTGDGLAGSINDSAWFDGALWVAGSRGVAKAERANNGEVHFRSIVETELEAYELLEDDAGVLIGERFGLLWLPRGSEKAERLWDGDGVYFLLRSRHDPKTVYAGTQNHLLRLQRRNQSWAILNDWPLEDIELSALIEGQPHELWIGNGHGAAQRWILSDKNDAIVKQTNYGTDQGLTLDPLDGSSVMRLDEQVFAQSGSNIFRFDGDRFVPFDEPPFNLVQRQQELDIVETPLGDYAFTTRELWHRAADGEAWQALHRDAQLPRGYSRVHMDADGRLRIVVWGGLLQYDPIDYQARMPPLQISISRVEYRHDQQTLQLLPLHPDGGHVFDEGATLRLRFALISMETGAEVRWRIPGRVDEWSEWSPISDSSISFGSLDASTYAVQIEGRVPSGRDVQALDFRFQVRPLWYRSKWAMGLALLLGLGLVALIVQLVSHVRYRNFLAINQRLERKIAERTHELENANVRLAELATEDSLTGVANRRAMEQALTREWQRCAETGAPLGVIMLDVDYFKRYNDQHGHLQGDQCLKWVAAELLQMTKPVRELVARFGGEEFVLILPGTSSDQAAQRAEHIRRRFAGSDSQVTVSIGVAVRVPQLDADPLQLLQQADAALYRAKRRGRNRVELAED